MTVINAKRGSNTNLVSFLLIGPVSDELEDDFFRKLFFELNFECADARSCTIKRSVNVVLRVNMPEDHPVPK